MVYGTTSTISSIILIGLTINLVKYNSIKIHFNNFKEVYSTKRIFKWCILAIFLSLILSIIQSYLLLPPNSSDKTLLAIVRVAILVPILEEFLFRKMLLGYFTDASKSVITFKDWLTFFLISVFLILPQIVLKLFGWITDTTNYWIIIFLMSTPCIIWSLHTLESNGFINKKLKHIFLIIFIIMIQSFIFASWHGSNTSWLQQSMDGFLYGILYILSKNLIPSTIAHSIKNIYLYFI